MRSTASDDAKLKECARLLHSVQKQKEAPRKQSEHVRTKPRKDVALLASSELLELYL